MFVYSISNPKVHTPTFFLPLKIYTTLGYIVSLILLNLGHVFCFRIVSRVSHVTHTADDVKAKHVSQVQED